MPRKFIKAVNKQPLQKKGPSIPAPAVMPNGKKQQDVLNCIHNKGKTGKLVGS